MANLNIKTKGYSRVSKIRKFGFLKRNRIMKTIIARRRVKGRTVLTPSCKKFEK